MISSPWDHYFLQDFANCLRSEVGRFPHCGQVHICLLFFFFPPLYFIIAFTCMFFCSFISVFKWLSLYMHLSNITFLTHFGLLYEFFEWDLDHR